MHPETASRVRQTWDLILPQRKTVCRDFYQRLFARYPELRALFKADIGQQAALFVTMINTVISALEHPQRVQPLVETLGVRHAEYGVQAADYAKFEEVLLETLSEALGDAFDADARAAWCEVFERLSATMQAGAGVSGADANGTRAGH
jgi:hemoglobin-like flavoprotein